MLLYRLVLCFLAFASFSLSAQHQNISRSAAPQWVDLLEPDLNATPEDDASHGFFYLVVDNQDHLETEEYYRRHAYRILNTKGVQDMADVTIDFDPEYQTVQLHSLNIIRDGKVLDKLDFKNLQVIQRESNMERYLYDGSLTIIANLTDVRSGDIIDYSFTLKGDNPVHQGKYQRSFFLEFPLSIDRHRYAIYVPRGEKIHYKKFNNAAEPVIYEDKTFTSYTWKNKDLQPIHYENNVPAWYDPAANIEVSQFGDWKEVVDQYQFHYTLDKAERRKLNVKAEKNILAAEEEGEYIDLAIRFVQDEIRYLGFENGLNSHKPRQPLEVLERRYGDCKDKSFLLSEILQAQGIEAYPMLVHSTNGKNLGNSLPSANIFDHCVVQIDFGNGKYQYIDPTISNQGGTVENLYFPDYRYGLVLKAGETSLTKLPAPFNPQTSITETFQLDEIGGGATLDVETIYRGSSADFRRRQFAENSRQSIQQDFTTFYSNLYPSIASEKNVSYRDYRDLNEFIVYEQYRVDSIWSPGPEQNHMIFAEFYPLSLHPNLFPEKFAGRKMPYYTDPTLNVSHKTIVFLPEEWPIANEINSFGDENFRYDFLVNYTDSRMELTHNYESLNDHVSPEDLSSYLAEHEKAQNILTYSLSYDTTFGQLGQENSTTWLPLILMLLVIGGAGFLCVKIYRNYDLPSRVKANREQKIGGWLVLIGIGLALTPIIVLAQMLNTSEYFDKAVWAVLFNNSESAPLGILLIFELIYNSAYLVFSVFVLVLFVQRRTIAPRIIIWFFGVTLVVTILDTFAAIQLSQGSLTAADEQELYVELGKTFLRSIIWIPYFIYSERVKETFTKTRKYNSEEEAEVVEHPPVIPV